jgi:hypothetical protein
VDCPELYPAVIVSVLAVIDNDTGIEDVTKMCDHRQ